MVFVDALPAMAETTDTDTDTDPVYGEGTPDHITTARERDVPLTQEVEDEDYDYVLLEVTHPHGRGHLIVGDTNGNATGWLEKAHRHNRAVNRRVLPAVIWVDRIGKVELNTSTKFYYEDEETRIILDDADVKPDTGELLLTFTEFRQPGFPRKDYTFDLNTLCDYLNNERLRTMKEQDSQLRDMLDMSDSSHG